MSSAQSEKLKYLLTTSKIINKINNEYNNNEYVPLREFYWLVPLLRPSNYLPLYTDNLLREYLNDSDSSLPPDLLYIYAARVNRLLHRINRYLLNPIKHLKIIENYLEFSKNNNEGDEKG